MQPNNTPLRPPPNQ